MAADRVIRWSTAVAVVAVAAVAAVASYEHAYAPVRTHGEAGWTARLVLLGGRLDLRQFDGDARLSAAQCTRARACEVAARPWCRVSTLAANVAHGLGHGAVGAGVAVWPAVALVGRRNRHLAALEPAIAAGQRPVDELAAVVADPETVCDERGWLSAERRGLSLRAFKGRQEAEVRSY
jgi:hypothetical protein